MRKTIHHRYRATVLYRGFLFGIMLFIVLLLIDNNSPISKSQFMSRFVGFVKDVSAQHDGYAPEDWSRSDQYFKRYTEKYYKRYSDELSEPERKTIWMYKRLYLYYRTKGNSEIMLKKFKSGY